jgi:conjugal transfer pilus assembly protein TraW
MMLLALLTLSFEVMAKDFGVQGEVFEIGEPDMYEYIQAKLKQMEREGSLGIKQEEMKRKVGQYVHRPLVRSPLSYTQKPKTWEHDPTYTVPEDIKDQDGHIMYLKGHKYNPLDYAPLETNLVLIDGDDEKQIKWAFKYLSSIKKPVKIILVNGAPLELMKKHKVRFYFDQQSILATKFGITQVPAIVSQKSYKLVIEEVLIGEGNG